MARGDKILVVAAHGELEIVDRARRAFHQVAEVERAAAVLEPAHSFDLIALHDLHDDSSEAASVRSIAEFRRERRSIPAALPGDERCRAEPGNSVDGERECQDEGVAAGQRRRIFRRCDGLQRVAPHPGFRYPIVQ